MTFYLSPNNFMTAFLQIGLEELEHVILIFENYMF